MKPLAGEWSGGIVRLACEQLGEAARYPGKAAFAALQRKVLARV